MDKVVEAVMMAKAGLVDDDDKPWLRCSNGTYGRGKNQWFVFAARNSASNWYRFDMVNTPKHTVAKLIGSTGPWVTEDGGLPDRCHPQDLNYYYSYSDEIEKAHSDI